MKMKANGSMVKRIMADGSIFGEYLKKLGMLSWNIYEGDELMIKQIREFILIRMEPNTKANEKMINKMGKAKNNGRMELNMKVSIFKGKKKEKAY